MTALRWARHLRTLGHEVKVRERWVASDAHSRSCELLIVLHAVRSAPSLSAFRSHHPDRPTVLVLTGTDVYGATPLPEAARHALSLADRIVGLQARAFDHLPATDRERARLVPQSARAVEGAPPPDPERFEVIVIGVLRPVKAPFVPARAVARLPARSRVHVVHVGGAYDERIERAARQEAASNPRWHWLGPLPRARTLCRLASSRALVVPSRAEGGPAVVPEAIAAGIPILASDMEASRALLGEDHPGLFPVDDDAALAALLLRAERDPDWLALLREHSLRLRPQVAPERERARIAELLAELVHDPAAAGGRARRSRGGSSPPRPATSSET